MRIFGEGLHDYYDSLTAHGDPVVFNREKDRKVSFKDAALLYGVEATHRFIALEENKKLQRQFNATHARYDVVTRDGKRYDFEFPHVIVAGKLYRGVTLRDQNYMLSYKDRSSRTFWTYESLKTWLEENGIKLDTTPKTKWELKKDSRRPLDEYFNVVEDQTMLSKLAEHKIVVMICVVQGALDFVHSDKRYWHVNGVGLDSLEFYKVMNAPTIYQEIDMWVSGTIGHAGREMVTISDKDKVSKHGFNDWSFRKHKDDAK